MRNYPLQRPTYLDAFSYVNNTTLNAGVGGDTLQTVDHAGVKTPVSHLADPTTQTQMAAVSAAGALKVDPSAVTQPVSAATLPLPTGAATETTLGGVLTTSDFDTKTGSLTEAAPASDTASSGLNGRLQRIAQRITTLIGSTLATSNAAASQVDGHSATLGATTDASSATSVIGLLKAIKAFFTAGAGSRLDVNANNTAGDVAAGSADSGNPVKVGAKAINAEPSALTTGQRANLITDLVGKLITLPYANPENFVSGALAADLATTTPTSLIAAPGAGLRNYITNIFISNAHATVTTRVDVTDGSGGTVLYTGFAVANGGGFSINFPVPFRQPTANTAIFVVCGTTGAQVRASASGYKGA